MKSIQNLIIMIKEYGEVSGFKINVEKTSVLTKNITKLEELELYAVSGFNIVKI